MQPLFGAIALDSHMAQHKAAFLLVAQQCCLTQKAALWFNLSSPAFLVRTAGQEGDMVKTPIRFFPLIPCTATVVAVIFYRVS